MFTVAAGHFVECLLLPGDSVLPGVWEGQTDDSCRQIGFGGERHEVWLQLSLPAASGTSQNWTVSRAIQFAFSFYVVFPSSDLIIYFSGKWCQAEVGGGGGEGGGQRRRTSREGGYKANYKSTVMQWAGEGGGGHLTDLTKQKQISNHKKKNSFNAPFSNQS